MLSLAIFKFLYSVVTINIINNSFWDYPLFDYELQKSLHIYIALPIIIGLVISIVTTTQLGILNVCYSIHLISRIASKSLNIKLYKSESEKLGDLFFLSEC